MLHLIPSLSGGGAERQVSYLIPALVANGVDAYLGYVTDGPNAANLEAVENRVHQISAKGNYDVKRYFGVMKLIDSLRPHIVQTWLPQMDILGGIIAGRSGIPFVLSERSTTDLYSNSFRDRARILVGRRASAIVANSDEGIDYWRVAGVTNKLVMIPNGIPTTQILESANRSNDTNPTSEILLFAGRYVRSKNVFATLDVFLAILELRPNARAYFFGGGELHRELELAAASSKHSARISVQGYSDELWHWMAQASVFVSLSEYEGQPNAVLEAATVGCPLVLSDVPGHRRLLDNRGAWFVDSQDLVSTISAIRGVLERPGDAARKVRVAQSVACSMTVEKSASRYKELYEEIVCEQFENG